VRAAQGRLLRVPQHHGHRLLQPHAWPTACSTKRAWPVSPAPAFGEFGEGHLRFSYATSMENIQEALRRIKGWIER
jgi:bifunctional pyridoxal-dependent enzyme with beta-cystathionase and maltose regulon repressor activities